MITFSQLGNYGRFGNQLFQIASTIGIATKNNQNYIFPEWKYNKYFNNKLPIGKLENTKHCTEISPYYSDIVLSNKYNWDLKGYFQSWKYFDHCKDLVKQYFTPNFKMNDNSVDLVSVHVRRGDYIGLSNIHNNLTKEYYLEAMRMFPNQEFIIFSDDIDFCINSGWFDSSKCTYKISEKSRGIEDEIPEELLHLFYMSKCKAHIIANSSYSWWAAYLSGSREVISPKNYVIGEDRDDRIPPEWTKI